MDRAALTAALEATGVCWLALHAWLTAHGVTRVVVLNPLQTRAFRDAELRGSKTDRSDAVAIARLARWMGAALSHHVPPNDRRAAARDVSRLRTEVVELRARQLVRLGAVLDRVSPEYRAASRRVGRAGRARALGHRDGR